MRAEGQPYNDPKKPGRLDIDGVEWWACDPYPTWYRWEGHKLHVRARYDDEGWADD